MPVHDVLVTEEAQNRGVGEGAEGTEGADAETAE